MRALRLLLSVMIFLCGLLPLAAQDYEAKQALLDEGVAAYQQHDFARAITAWGDSGVRQLNMYYNIARAYEYLGQWGDARVNDRRAQVVHETFYNSSPQPDLQAALERGWARQDIETLHPLLWLKNTLHEITRPLGWGVVGVLLWVGVWSMLVVYLRRRVGGRFLVGLITVLILWFGVIEMNSLFDRAFSPAVSVESTPIYSGPGVDYVTLATWSEGYDLYILEMRGDWARVMRADGVSGWLERRLIAELPVEQNFIWPVNAP